MKSLSLLDRVCAALAFVCALGFLVLGAFGLVFGVSFRLAWPPIVGGLPVLIGWGILRSVIVAWPRPAAPGPARVSKDGRISQDLRCAKCGYNLRMLHSGRACPECGLPITGSASSFVVYEPPDLYRPSREDIERATPEPPDGDFSELERGPKSRRPPAPPAGPAAGRV
jgi:hypothetical protein